MKEIQVSSLLDPDKARMTTVLHLRSSFDPGGTETLLLNLFNHPQRLFVMYLVLLKDGTLIRALDTSQGNEYFPWFRKGFIDWALLRRLNRLIAEKEVKIIHSHQLIELIYAVLLKIANPKLKLIHQVHLLFDRRDVAFYLERSLAQRFARIITVSHAAKKALHEEFGYRKANIEVLYNAVEPLSRNKRTDPGKEVLQPGPDPKRCNVVMVANFVWGKDHETVFKAYDAFLREQAPDVSLWFIGRESPLSEALKDKYVKPEDHAEERIVFTGPIPDAKRLLHRFDIVLQSSFSETFNLALVEAVSQGMPVLASDIDVFRELSEQGEHFPLFQTGNPQDLAEKLLALKASLPPLEQSTRTGQHFAEKFGYERFTRQLDQIYTDTLLGQEPVPTPS